MSKDEENAADVAAAMDDVQASVPPSPPTPDLETNGEFVAFATASTTTILDGSFLIVF